jgi:hypothetical protein
MEGFGEGVGTEPLPPEIEVEGIQGAGPQIFIGGAGSPQKTEG